MAIASGTDGAGSAWLALYCDNCASSVSSTETFDVDELRHEHGWRGHLCARCADGRDDGSVGAG